MNYCAIPHCTTKVPPATALFGRIIRVKLPMESTTVNMDEINRMIDKADDDAKVKREAYADNRRVAKEPSFMIGDQVLVITRNCSYALKYCVDFPKQTIILTQKKRYSDDEQIAVDNDNGENTKFQKLNKLIVNLLINSLRIFDYRNIQGLY